MKNRFLRYTVPSRSLPGRDRTERQLSFCRILRLDFASGLIIVKRDDIQTRISKSKRGTRSRPGSEPGRERVPFLDLDVFRFRDFSRDGSAPVQSFSVKAIISRVYWEYFASDSGQQERSKSKRGTRSRPGSEPGRERVPFLDLDVFRFRDFSRDGSAGAKLFSQSDHFF